MGKLFDSGSSSHFAVYLIFLFIFLTYCFLVNCSQVKYSSTSSEDHQFVRGIPVYAISQVLEKIITGGNGPALLINGVKRPMPLVRILEVELYPTLLSKARSFGLSDEWIQVSYLFIYSLYFCLDSLCLISCLLKIRHSQIHLLY